MRQKIYLAILMLLLPLTANSLGSELIKKYPYSVLTDDYGILNEHDLSRPRGFTPPRKFPDGKLYYFYWQCFPRKDVRISLRDIGYSSFNIDDNDSELTIEAYTISETHQYGMRRDWPVRGNEKAFDGYQKIMRGQKYICLQGTYFFYKDSVTDGKKNRTYYWTFEKMKTKKGCESYFEGRCQQNQT